ncbi:hypothetical protein CY34DRAFT_799745, partial [Suillus luteus UH-Slu-Lm8-n1]
MLAFYLQVADLGITENRTTTPLNNSSTITSCDERGIYSVRWSPEQNLAARCQVRRNVKQPCDR